MSADPCRWIADELRHLDERHLRRRRQVRTGPMGAIVEVGQRRLVNLAANDYLGLAHHPAVVQAAREAMAESGFGAGASPLIAGYTPWHQRLEKRLARFEGQAAALVFGSGFAANTGTLSALAGREDGIFADQWNHASLIDGCRLSRAAVHVYPHADIAHLEQLLAEHRHYRRRLIVTDTLFSMEGDLAPLAALCELAERHDCLLVVDEAHATGVWGPEGRGVVEMLGLEQHVPVRVGTLSKALGSIGGFVAGQTELIDWLVNRARSYIFSTALPPACCAAAEAAVQLVEQEPQRRHALVEMARSLRCALAAQGWTLGQGQSQIIPVIVQEPERALALSAQLRERGYWVPAIRPPSVPTGRSLLRISLCYDHTPQMIDGFLASMEALSDRGRNG